MQYAPLGISYKTGKLLSEPLSDTNFAEMITGAKAEMVRKAKGGMGLADWLRNLKPKSNDPFDKEKNKWTYVISENEPKSQREEIKKAIKPLADLRGMRIPDQPLVYRGGNDEMDWLSWLSRTYRTIPKELRPDYILLIGSPDLIPFGFQAKLDLEANVGRVDFDTIADLKNYVKKICDFYDKPPKLQKEVLFFATNHGIVNNKRDATHYSLNHMVNPLIDYCKKNGIAVTSKLENEATKTNLIESFQKSEAVLAYAACHGVGDVDGLDENKQKELVGAMCCQNYLNNKNDETELLRAVDIPMNESFLSWGVFFQFSCFSYGTPKYNTIAKFSLAGAQKPIQLASKDFVASIPKKLLAHSKGPVAFIGHVDAAWLAGFYDGGKVADKESERRELDVYESIIESIFNKQTLGAAMHDMNMKFAQNAGAFTNLILTYQQQKGSKAPKDQIESTAKDLGKTFIVSNDSENFMLFGDPALSFFHVL